MFSKTITTILGTKIHNFVILICLLGLIISPVLKFFHIIPEQFSLTQGMSLLTLVIVAELLFLALRVEKKNELEKGILNSGIISFFPDLSGREYESLMKQPGNKILLNTWLYNFESTERLLKEALDSKRTTIDFTVIKPEEENEVNYSHAYYRGQEIGKKIDKGKHIEFLGPFLHWFYKDKLDKLKSKDDDKRIVKVYQFDSVPKISIYACGEKAFVSNYWPDVHAADAPQFLIEGKEGNFSKNVWKYYEGLEKKEITQNIFHEYQAYKNNKKRKNEKD